MKQERPLLIVTSCTRNYGWVTRAFLEGNTRWADFIVIVDQMSTDATRPLTEEYNALHSRESKVDSRECIHRAEIVIVDDPDMTYKENTRAKMGFMRGRKLAAGRDTIYFALDIDEVMPANWMQTEDGKKILNSKPGDMFQLKWANLMPDNKNYEWDTDPKGSWQYKIYHDNPNQEWQSTVSQIHTPLLPYTSWDVEPEFIHDFPLMHFGYYFPLWNHYKERFYCFQYVRLDTYKSIFALLRDKAGKVDLRECEYLPIKSEWFYKDIDLYSMVDTTSTPMMLQYVKDIIAEDGIEKYNMLDVYDQAYMQDLGISKDPRPWYFRLLHSYIRATDKYRGTFIVRAMDKIMKRLI